MNRRSFRNSFVLLLLLHWLGFLAPTAIAQRNNDKNNNRRDEQRENQRVQKAEREFAVARNELNEKQAELKIALRKVDAIQDKLVPAKRSLKEAEDAAESELGASLGIPEAIAKVNALQREYESSSKPILDALHARPEWSKVQAEAAKAKVERELLRENTEVEDDERDSLLKKIVATIQYPFDVEAKALAIDAKSMDAKKAVDEASAELAQLRKKLTPGKVDKHPKVIAAQKSLDEIQKDLSKVEKELTACRTVASKVQKSFNAAQVELNRAKQADAADSNKGKKK